MRLEKWTCWWGGKCDAQGKALFTAAAVAAASAATDAGDAGDDAGGGVGITDGDGGSSM